MMWKRASMKTFLRVQTSAKRKSYWRGFLFSRKLGKFVLILYFHLPRVSHLQVNRSLVCWCDLLCLCELYSWACDGIRISGRLLSYFSEGEKRRGPEIRLQSQFWMYVLFVLVIRLQLRTFAPEQSFASSNLFNLVGCPISYYRSSAVNDLIDTR